MMLSSQTIAQGRDGLRNGDYTAVELTEYCLQEIAKSTSINAFCHLDEEFALNQARDADKKIITGDTSDLCGIPLGIKDIFCVKGLPTQAASKILEGFKPPYESTVTNKLRTAGSVLLGKLNMDEFAMGSSNEHSVYGPVTSPWRATGSTKPLTPGGSSGGSAAAVAADLCLGAIGTDTGGSIRQPAAFSGIVGMKPTYGRCSRWGIVAFASSLDQAGPMTKSVRDAAIMLTYMSGHDPKDSTSSQNSVPRYEDYLEGSIKGLKIGIPREYKVDGMPFEIIKAWDDAASILANCGVEIVDISLPHTKYALPAYYVIAPAEASSNLARYDGVRYGYRANLDENNDITHLYKKTRNEGFGAEVKRRVMIGTYVLSQGFYEAYYRRAQRVRTLIRQDFEDAFNSGIHAILTPATPSSAFAIGEMADSDPIKMYLNDVFTVTVNLAGLPGISLPLRLDKNGLPLGLQLIGRPWEEGDLLNCAWALENQAGFDYKPEHWWDDA